MVKFVTFYFGKIAQCVCGILLETRARGVSQGPAPHLSFLLASATQTFLFPFSDFSPLLSLNDDQFYHLSIPGDTYVHKRSTCTYRHLINKRHGT